jgi:hypothetical protein
MPELKASDFDWEKLYERLEKTSESLIPPDQNFSSKSFVESFDSAGRAETFTTKAWARFSRFKRDIKDRVKRSELALKIKKLRFKDEYEFEGATRKEVEEKLEEFCHEEILALEESKSFLEDISLFMDALSKVSGRIKHFREDLGRQLKLAEMERN